MDGIFGLTILLLPQVATTQGQVQWEWYVVCDDAVWSMCDIREQSMMHAIFNNFKDVGHVATLLPSQGCNKLPIWNCLSFVHYTVHSSYSLFSLHRSLFCSLFHYIVHTPCSLFSLHRSLFSFTLFITLLTLLFTFLISFTFLVLFWLNRSLSLFTFLITS